MLPKVWMQQDVPINETVLKMYVCVNVSLYAYNKNNCNNINVTVAKN